MDSFEVEVAIKAERHAVLEAFWDLEEWPKLASHVRAIQMLYCDANVQVLMMEVETKGRVDRFQSVRILQANSIYFFQPTPPPMLARHHGSWRFEENGAETLVISQHVLDINLAFAERSLTAINHAENSLDLKSQIISLLRNNSLQTMLSLKARLEKPKEVYAS